MFCGVLRRSVPLVLIVTAALAGCGNDTKEPSAAASTSLTTSAAAVESTTTTTAAPTTTTTAAGLSENTPLEFDRIGPIKVGMTLAQATAAAGKPVKYDPSYPFDFCGHAKVEGGPEGLVFMVRRAKETDPWHIARIDVDGKSRIATASGIRIGATEAEVKQAYSGPGKEGTLKVEPHEYTEAGHYITYDVDGPEGNLLLFETDGTKVTRFRSGQQEPVGYVEGCA
jgi:hypothetical protein